MKKCVLLLPVWLWVSLALSGCFGRVAPFLTRIDLDMGPDVIYTGQNTALKLFWGWHAPATFRLDWGTDRSYALGSAMVQPNNVDADIPAGKSLYTYTIQGLTPGTHYEYRLVIDQHMSDGSFRTAPADNAVQLKFVSYGDTRSHPEIHDAVAAQVVRLFQKDPSYQTFNLMTGDLVDDGDKTEDWNEQFFNSTYKNIRAELAHIAFLPVMGNHEGSGNLFRLLFPMPFVAARYWSFDYGPAHVAMLDQYTDDGPESAQYAWLKRDLAASNKIWKFAVLHKPGWSSGGGHKNNADVQEILQPLFQQYGVAIVFGGHNHYYSRAVVDGVQHLTIGTGGAPEYPPEPGYPNVNKTYAGAGYGRFEIDANRLTGWFYDTNGFVQDTFTIQK